MTPACTRCGEGDLPARSVYCFRCGAALIPGDAPEPGACCESPLPYTPRHLEPVLRQDAAALGELKEVTVVVADVAGSLAMANALDPEDVHAVMNELFELATQAVHEAGGTINQFRGDGFMALFGAPRAQGDDAVRALRAALAVRSGAEKHGRRVQERFGVPLALRIGVNTGTVWVGSIGADLRLDYTAEGITVGVAARLEQAAAAGEILVSEETARRTRPYFELESKGAIQVRGLKEPVTAFALRGAGAFDGRIDVERSRGLTPFFGREAEAGQLAAAQARAAQSGVVWAGIVGEPGIGKSRLALEHAAQHAGSVLHLELRCHETNANRAFAPFAERLASWPLETPSAAEVSELRRRLIHAPGPGAPDRGAIVTALCGMVTDLAAKRPVLLVVEDVHWIDPSSRLVLEALLLRGFAAPILVLATSRPPLGPGLPEAACVLRLDLSPLGRTHSEEIARSILGDVPEAAALSALAVERAGGNPLFLEEVSRTLRDGPPALRRSAQLEMALRQATVRVPETLQSVVAARVDGLPERAKRVLEAVAVNALPFGPEVVSELEPEAAAGGDVQALLEDLTSRGLLARTPEGAYAFRHGVVREVAYRQILRARRRQLHRRCAESLGRAGDVASPALASRIGTHYDLAGEPALAVEHLTRAGDAYLGMLATPEAAAHLQRAWELVHLDGSTEPALRASIGVLLASALNLLDRAGESAAVLEQFEASDLGAADSARVASACIESGWVSYSSRNEWARGVALIERGLALLDETPESRRTECQAHTYLLRLHQIDGGIARSLSSADRVLELTQAAGDRFGRAYALANLAATHCDAGNLDAASVRIDQAVAIARESENELAIGFTHTFLAKVWVFRGSAPRAIEAAELAEAAGERIGQVSSQYLAVLWKGEAFLLAGDVVRAAAEFDRLAAINSSWPSTLDRRARGRLELGELAEALDLSQRCLALTPPRLVRTRALWTYATALSLTEPGRAAEAEASLLEAVSICDTLGLRPQLAESHLGLAELADRRGERTAAQYFGRRAIDGFAACGMLAHASRARASLRE